MISGLVPTMVITLSTDGLAHDVELHEHVLDLGDIQSLGIVRGVVVALGDRHLTFIEILVVVQLARIGGPNDGGYLMCANLTAGLESAYSYGIGGDDSWGCAVSRTHRVPVHQYDCFEPTKVQCPGAIFHLNAECVGPRTEQKDGRPFETLARHLARNGDAGRRVVVKMDVEGAEWDTILGTPDDVLAAIDQMPMELHGLDEPGVLAGLRKLKTHFHLVSVHFNNQSCTAGAKPLPASAYQVLFVNKRIGIVGPPPPGRPTPESLMAPDDPTIPDCQAIAR